MSASLNLYKNNADGTFGGFVEVTEELEVNMANMNALAVVTALGFNFEDFCIGGEIEEIIKACDLYLTSELGELVDNGRPTTESLDHGVRVVYCGIEAGYIRERVEQIKAAALMGKERGATKFSIC